VQTFNPSPHLNSVQISFKLAIVSPDVLIVLDGLTLDSGNITAVTPSLSL